MMGGRLTAYLMAGVLLFPSLALAQAKAEYQRLCMEIGGGHVFEKVDGVEGILDAVSETRCDYCEYVLLTGGYDFVEYKFTPRTKRTELRYQFANSHGLHRFTLEEPNHPNCRLFYELFQPRIKLGRGIAPHYKGKCIATWKVDKIKAKYKITEQNNLEEYNDGIIQIQSRKYYRITDNKLVGEYNLLTLAPFRVPGDPSSRKRSDLQHCPEDGFFAMGEWMRTVLPARKAGTPFGESK